MISNLDIPHPRSLSALGMYGNVANGFVICSTDKMPCFVSAIRLCHHPVCYGTHIKKQESNVL